MTHEVTNDPTHECELPGPAAFPYGTDVMCTIKRADGLYADGRCGRKFTRTTTFWRHLPRWSSYDYGW